MADTNPYIARRSRIQAMKQLKPKAQKAAKLRTEAEKMLVRCPDCSHKFERSELRQNLYMCPECNHLFKMPSQARLDMVFDDGRYDEIDENLVAGNPLNFPGYMKKLENSRATTGMNEAVRCAEGCVGGVLAEVVVLDSRFLMGSMGVAVGEKITRAVEHATEKKLPLIIFSASGGARMQEGIYSLMQMAKTSAAIEQHSKAGLLYISVMTNPTTGGVTASFASLGDIIIAEPNALIGFAGPRVIEQTIKQSLPEGFQRSESLLKHGFLDGIVNRVQMKGYLAYMLQLHIKRGE